MNKVTLWQLNLPEGDDKGADAPFECYEATHHGGVTDLKVLTPLLYFIEAAALALLPCFELEPALTLRSLDYQAVEANNQVYVLTTSTKGSYSLYQVPQDLFTGGMHTQPSPSFSFARSFFSHHHFLSQRSLTSSPADVDEGQVAVRIAPWLLLLLHAAFLVSLHHSPSRGSCSLPTFTRRPPLPLITRPSCKRW